MRHWKWERAGASPARQAMAERERHCDESFCLFGAQVLQKRLQALTREIAGVREAKDLEYVHRMRVASRRLRAAFAIFEPCFPAAQMGRWNRRIKRITRALGAARDTDVQIAFVEEFLSRIETQRERRGVERLLLRLRQRRQALQADVIRTLDRLESNGVLRDMEETLLQRLVEARVNQTPETSPWMYRRACEMITLRLEEMLAYEVYIHQPEHITQLHSMRIAAKRLRYTMEVFEPLYNGEMKKHIQVVKTVQEMLGDIHDADVWAEQLPVFIAEERARTREYCGSEAPARRLLPGLEALRADRQAFRQQRYKEFLSYWKDLGRDDVWGDLRTLVLERAQEAVRETSLPEAVLELAPDPASE